MSMPVLSSHQPDASLCVTRQPCDGSKSCSTSGHIHGCYADACGGSHYHDAPMAKSWETRSWPCPPNLIGQRIALHATKRHRPNENVTLGPWRYQGASHCLWSDPRNVTYLPLGAVVGSAVIEACYPIVGEHDNPLPKPWIERTDQNLLHLVRWDGWTDVSDQLPYGDFTAGRYAWLLTDAAPVQERCPWCWGERWLGSDEARCPACNAAGRCEPIPAKGGQRIWYWDPTKVAA